MSFLSMDQYCSVCCHALEDGEDEVCEHCRNAVTIEPAALPMSKEPTNNLSFID